jgi:hypothetical protein
MRMNLRSERARTCLNASRETAQKSRWLLRSAAAAAAAARASHPTPSNSGAYLVEHQPESILATHISNHTATARRPRTVFVQTRSKASLRCVQLSLATTPRAPRTPMQIHHAKPKHTSLMHANCISAVTRLQNSSMHG